MTRFAPVLAFALALAAAPASALGPVAFGPTPDAAGWEMLTFRGKTPAAYSAPANGTLDIRAERAVSVLWRPLPRSFADAQAAQWRWRVDQGVPATNLARRRGDDRAIALYFVFADDPSALDNPPATLRQAFSKGRALMYVWGGDQAAGTIVDSPHLRGRGRMVIRQPAGAGPWQAESVDIRGDFRRAFGREPGPLVGLGISTDSDDTGTVNRAAPLPIW